MTWNEPDPEVIGGAVVVFNCGPAMGAYATTSAEVDAALESIKQDNEDMQDVLEGRSTDARHASSGDLPADEYSQREAARDIVEAKVNERDVED